MLKLYACVAEQHNLWMVVIAAVICAFGAYATFAIGIYAVRSPERTTRMRWGAMSLVTTACTIWATHFIAMIAFRVPFPSGYAALPTVLSFFVGLALVLIGGSIAVRRRNRRASTVAGFITGCAISAMHYVGMSAFRTTGAITWDHGGVAASIVIGIVFCTAAGWWSWGRKAPRLWGPTLLLSLAVCGDHFVAMSAATIAYDPSVTLPDGLIDGKHLSWIVAFVACAIVCAMLFAFRRHLQSLRRSASERQRLHDVADLSVEGLLICDGERIVWANRSVETLTGVSQASFVGCSIEALFSRATIDAMSQERETDAVIRCSGAIVPVRLITKAIALDDRSYRLVAIRDQRERLHAEAELRRLAQSDPLTGLANRARFNDVLEQMLRSRRSDGRDFALLSLDLDGFKKVNDAHGQGVGDALLVRVAGRLGAVVRDSHLVARIGGDEFSIISPQIDGPDGARALADRIVEMLSRPFVFDGRIHDIAASVGVALAPSDGDTASVLVRNAELALDRAKADGGNAYRMFEAGMDARMQARRAIELALRRAAARQELEVYYQPQVDARTGCYTGAEALIRWNDPERGLVPPSEFIAIAEETNLIAGIGEWVLRTACVQAMTWPTPLNVAVNLSPVQFRDPRLASIVASALEESGLPGHRLELEITESVLIDDEVGVLALLEHFRAMGVRIALDDFGTGYSSLGHLRRFPFDKIKIDRSFVSRATEDRECAAIVRAIVSLGTSLGIRTVAEGVETVAQRRFVTDEGCDQIQGYLFSRPVRAHQLPPEFRQATQEPPWPSSSFSIAATAS